MTGPSHRTIIHLAAGARPRRGDAPGATAESVSTVPRGTLSPANSLSPARGVVPRDAHPRPDQRLDITAGPGRGHTEGSAS